MTAPSPSPTPPPAVDQVREVLAAAVVAAVGPLLPAGWVWQPDRFTAALLPAVSALLAEARADELEQAAKELNSGGYEPVPTGGYPHFDCEDLVASHLRDRASSIRAAIRQTEGNNR